MGSEELADNQEINDTEHLNSIPGYIKTIKESMKEDKNNCKVYQKDEE